MIGTVATAAKITDPSRNRCNLVLENRRVSELTIFRDLCFVGSSAGGLLTARSSRSREHCGCWLSPLHRTNHILYDFFRDTSCGFFETRLYNVTPIHFTSPMTTASRGQGAGSQAG